MVVRPTCMGRCVLRDELEVGKSIAFLFPDGNALAALSSLPDARTRVANPLLRPSARCAAPDT